MIRSRYKKIISSVLVGIILGVGTFYFRTPLAQLSWDIFGCSWCVRVINPENEVLHQVIGDYYFSTAHYDLEKAKKYFRRVISINETAPLAHYQLSRVYFIEGNLYESLKEINREIALYPEYGRSYYIRGLVYGYSNELDKSISDFKKFLEWQPMSWAGHNDIVWVFFMKGDLLSAEKYARAGLESAPRNPWLSNALGAILLNKGQYKEAKEYLLQAYVGFSSMEHEEWGRSYPGNNPEIYGEGLGASLGSVEENLLLLEKKWRGG